MFMKRLYRYLFSALLSFFFTACITPFIPNHADTQGGALVIEGDIILDGYTKVYLSESRALDSSDPIRYITNAQVMVQSDEGEEYNGTVVYNADAPPFFLIDTRALPYNRKYSLCVTLEGSFLRFISEPQTPLITPEIGSIDFVINEASTEVDVMITSHGEHNSSPFYKWSYLEDWEIVAQYRTNVVFDLSTNQLLLYPDTYPLLYCWDHSESASIMVGRTDHLQSNRIYQQLNTIDYRSNKISYLYYTEVQQMSISEEAYTYWINLRKNNDEIGGIFAPQPSEMYGNIRLVSSLESNIRALGYISVGTVDTKSVFVSEAELGIYKPPFFCRSYNPDDYMEFDVIPQPFEAGFLPVGWSLDEIEWVSSICVDCRRQGNKNKPSFWPNDHW